MNIKKILLFFLLSFAFLISANVYAVGSYGVDLNSDGYVNKQYIYPYGECTWYAWGRTYEKNGISLSWSPVNGHYGNAKDWYNNASSAYAVDQTPQTGAIAVSSDGEYGHVMYIEYYDKDANLICISEGNYSGNYHEDIIHLDSNSRKSNGAHINITGYIHPDTNAPVMESISTAKSIFNDSFIISFGVTDESKIDRVYAKVWKWGQTVKDAKTIEGTYSDGTGTIRVNASEFDGVDRDYYIICGAVDSYGQYTEKKLCSPISLYKISTADTGTYRTKNKQSPTFIHAVPYEEINDKSTLMSYLQPSLDEIDTGVSVEVVGSYTNEWGAKYYKLADGGWIYADYLQWVFSWSEMYDKLVGCLNDMVYYFAEQVVAEATRSASPSATVPMDDYATSSYSSGWASYAQKYTVSFDTNGSDRVINSKEIPAGHQYGTLPTPYRSGYTFKGWYTEKDGGSKVTASMICNGDITLYANWKKSATSHGVPVVVHGIYEYHSDIYYILYADGLLYLTNDRNTYDLLIGYEDPHFSGYWHTEICNKYRNIVTDTTISDTMTKIPGGAFSNCSNLKSVTIPESVTAIHSHAFYFCTGLTSITIPENVRYVDSESFTGCNNLTDINVLENNPYYSSEDGVLFYKDKTVLIQYPGGKTGAYTIPNSVKSIESRAFEWCSNPTSITISDSVTSIGSCAFRDCGNLKEVKIGNGVTSIGSNAFNSCNSLETITIPNSVTNIEDYAFQSCGNLKEVKFGNGVTSIGSNAFSSCNSLESITIPDSVKTIGTGAFGNCCNLKEVEIGNGITSIGSGAFGNCYNLKEVEIGNGVISIGSGAFGDCDSLESIIIPDSVTSIGAAAFRNCDSLESITIPDSVISIGESIFDYCRNLKSVNLGNSVTNIGKNAFYYCDQLTSIVIPDSVTTIGEYAFCYCNRLKDVSIGNGVKSIGKNAFYYCENITSIVIPEGVTTIGDWAFESCYKLKSMTIPKSMTTIGNYIFGYNVTDVYYSGSEEDWKKISIGAYGNQYLENATIHYNYVPSVIYGDCDGNGEFTPGDIVFLARHLAGWKGYDQIDTDAADVSGDGKVNALDNIILARHSADWIGYETLPYFK